MIRRAGQYLAHEVLLRAWRYSVHTALRLAAWCFFKLTLRTEVVGRENVPKTGPMIVASDHKRFADSFGLAALLHRNLIFLSKEEHFHAPGVWGWALRHGLKNRTVPVKRNDKDSGRVAFMSLLKVLRKKGGLGIHPEETRVPTDDVYRGKEGVVALALLSGAVVVPVAIVGPRKFAFRAQFTLIVGVPMTFAYDDASGLSRRVQREKMTRELMETIARLGGQRYIHRYAVDVKAELDDVA